MKESRSMNIQHTLFTGPRRLGVALAAATVAVMLAGCATSSDESSPAGDNATSIAVQLEWLDNPEYGSFYLADHEGYFAEEGLDVDLMGGGPNAVMPAQAVASGAVQFGYATQMDEVVTAVQAGTPLVILGVNYQVSWLGWTSLSSNPVKSLADFVDKRVALPPSYVVSLQAEMEAAGLPPRFTTVPYSEDASILAKGGADVYAGFYEDDLRTLAALGIDDPVQVTVDDLTGEPTYTGYLITTSTYLKEHRDIVVGFMRALAKGTEKFIADPSEVAKIVVDDYAASQGLDPDIADAAAHGFAEGLHNETTDEHGVLWVDPAKIGGSVYNSVRFEGITDLPEVDTIVDTSVLEEVYAEGTTLLN
jgi:ABC-type nitrate/sulfonate/bicarbonate transport system substrate-binding protein